MATSSPPAQYFDEYGRRVIGEGLRVFDSHPLDYYFIKNNGYDFGAISESYRASGYFPTLDDSRFASCCEQLRCELQVNSVCSGLFNGVHVPFAIPKTPFEEDLAISLVEARLPFLEKAFKARYPEAHFKAIMQGGTNLRDNLRIASSSRYEGLVKAISHGDVYGWYFPQALQQFDISSQTAQMRDLPDDVSLCLSGPTEIFSAVIGKPDLLINEDGYSPILCMSAVEHTDERLVLVLKTYGPHLEFWCLSQMLAPGVKQVSEQWAGGLTLYSLPQGHTQ